MEEAHSLVRSRVGAWLFDGPTRTQYLYRMVCLCRPAVVFPFDRLHLLIHESCQDDILRAAGGR